MTGKTHIVAGFLSGELLSVYLGFPIVTVPAGLIVGASMIGSLVPDIDHAKSTISTSNAVTKSVSRAVTSVSKHRGFVHTPVFVFLVVALLSLTSLLGRPLGWQMALGFAVGMISHLLLDSLNPTGIMWLWPILVEPVHFAAIRTSSKLERLFRAVLVIVSVVITWHLFRADLAQIL